MYQPRFLLQKTQQKHSALCLLCLFVSKPGNYPLPAVASSVCCVPSISRDGHTQEDSSRQIYLFLFGLISAHPHGIFFCLRDGTSLNKRRDRVNYFVLLTPQLTALIELPACAPLLLSPCPCRHVERHHQGGHKDAEAGHHVARGLPPRGSDHEEAPARQTGSSLCCGVRGAHLYRHRVHG